MQRITKGVITVWFCLAIIGSSYAMVRFDSNDITQADNNAQASVSKAAKVWDTGRYAPVYGHIPHWGKRLGYWIDSNR